MALEPQDRTPEQVAADIAFLRQLRAARAADPRQGRYGGTDDMLDEVCEDPA